MTSQEMIAYIEMRLNNNAGNENFDWSDEQFYFMINNASLDLLNSRLRLSEAGTVDYSMSRLSDIANLIQEQQETKPEDAIMINHLYSESTFNLPAEHYKILNKCQYLLNDGVTRVPIEILSMDKAQNAKLNPYRASINSVFGYFVNNQLKIVHPQETLFSGTNTRLIALYVKQLSIISSTVQSDFKQALHTELCDLVVNNVTTGSINAQRV